MKRNEQTREIEDLLQRFDSSFDSLPKTVKDKNKEYKIEKSYASFGSGEIILPLKECDDSGMSRRAQQRRALKKILQDAEEIQKVYIKRREMSAAAIRIMSEEEVSKARSSFSR